MNDILIIFLGILVGSFLNVCIYRIPRDESILYPRSHCTNCGHTLGSLELVPILSYIGLRGKCKYCQCRISPCYMGIEILTGSCFGMLYGQLGESIEMLIGCTFVCFAIVLAMIDWAYMILPTSIIRWGIGIGIIERILQARLLQNGSILEDAVWGAVVAYLLFMLVFYVSRWFLKKEGLGYGDVRFIGMIGFYLGIHRVFISIFLSSLLASIYGVILFKIRRKSEAYPLGPFLSIGGMITFLWGSQLLTSYLSLFNR